MKKLLSAILAITIMISCGAAAFAAAVGTVETLEAVRNGSSIDVSGTTANVNAAAAVQVLDADSNVIGMDSFVITENSFSGSVAFSGNAASVRAADYDGGPWKTVELPPENNDDEDYVVSYAIQLGATENGAAALSTKRAIPGQSVTVTVTPDEGFVLESVVITDRNGKEIELNDLGDGKYSFKMPDEAVSVEVVFAKLQGYITCLGDATCPASKFTDVDAAAWYHDGVHYCLDNGIMAGKGGGKFAPSGITTRAQIAQILYNLEGQPAFMNDNIFSDVVSGSWYEKAVVWAQGKNIVTGYPDGTFKPDASITREQLAVILYNYAKYKGIDVTVDENTNFLSFNDFWDTSEWAKPAMMWAIERELITGSNWDLKPQGDAVRAQAATVICKFCETVAK